jgi:hypothetical protein
MQELSVSGLNVEDLKVSVDDVQIYQAIAGASQVKARTKVRPFVLVRMDPEEEAHLRKMGLAAQAAMLVLRYAAVMRGNTRDRVVVKPVFLTNCHVKKWEVYRGVKILEAAEFITIARKGRRIVSYGLLDKGSQVRGR